MDLTLIVVTLIQVGGGLAALVVVMATIKAVTFQWSSARAVSRPATVEHEESEYPGVNVAGKPTVSRQGPWVDKLITGYGSNRSRDE